MSVLNSKENILKALSTHPFALIRQWESYKKEENYDDSKGIMGLSIGYFILVLCFVFLPFILAIYYLIKNRSVLPTWALILGWALLLSGFAIFALLIAVFVKEDKPVYPMGYPMAYPMAYPPGYQQNPAQTR